MLRLSLALVALVLAGPGLAAPEARFIDAPIFEVPHADAKELGVVRGPAGKSLDADLVVTIVRERALAAAGKLAEHVFEGLPAEPAVQVADVVALGVKLFRAKVSVRRGVVQSIARLGVRSLLADAWVRARFPDKTAATQSCLRQWTYWQLGRRGPLAGEGGSKPKCSEVAADDAEAATEFAALLGTLRLAVGASSRGGWLLALTEAAHLYPRLGTIGDGPLGAVVRPEAIAAITRAVGDLDRLRRPLKAAEAELQAAEASDPDSEDYPARVEEARNAVEQARQAVLVWAEGLPPDGGVFMQAFRRAAKGADLAQAVAVAQTMARLADSASDLFAAVPNAGLGALELGAVDRVLERLDAIAGELNSMAGDVGPTVKAMLDALSLEVDRQARALRALLAAAPLAGGEGSLEDVMVALRALGVVEDGVFTSPLLELVHPVVDALRAGGRLDFQAALRVLDEVSAEAIARAFGVEVEAGEDGESVACGGAREERGACWTTRLLLSVKAVADWDGDRVRVDGAQLEQILGALADDFRRREQWRWFLHFTVGTGLLNSEQMDAATGEESRRWVPLIAEQVGFGVASPAVLGDAVTLKLGLAGSGVLYRMLVDNEESEAVMLGGFVALDLFEDIELYGAGFAMLQPNEDVGDAKMSIAVGLQVPFGEYLTRIADD